jgi:sterol desaturase/sphingolipid hydroxylase (fatty acid hydroxylase superfamily)
MKAFIRTLWNGEIPEVSERYRWLGTAYVLVFVVSYSLGFLQLLHLSAYLGPGLGDNVSFAPVKASLDTLAASQHRWLLPAVLALLISTTLFRAAAMLAGYFLYRDAQGKAYPLRLLLVFFLVNMIATLMIPLVLGLLGIMSSLIGLGFEQGWHWISSNAALANHWVETRIPTLIDLPAPIAVIVFSVIAGFFHYWLHRLGHERRLLWRLFHRPHHMTPVLIQPTTLAVFTALPLFVFAVLPYNLILGACAKLVSDRPLYTEMIIYNCLLLIPEIFGHQTALYKLGSRSRLIRWASHLSGGGVYHYMHHSAEPEHCNRRGNNLVNIGGGPAFIWDHIFGTFHPLADETPRVGLLKQPALIMNPLRLALAGVSELIAELHKNRSWRVRWQILVGGSEYQPPVAPNFLLVDASPGKADPTQYHSVRHKPGLPQSPAQAQAQ